jgi:arginase
VLSQNHFPLCIGGDHSMGIGTIAGISSYCRKNKLKLGVIWIDAHADMNTDKTTPSGNIHGMPLAVSLGLGNTKLVNFYGFSPKLKPENTALIGVRSIDEFEKRNIKQMNLSVYTMSDVDKLGIIELCACITFREKVDHIHVSFDWTASIHLCAGGPNSAANFLRSHLLMESIAECGVSSRVTEVNRF